MRKIKLDTALAVVGLLAFGGASIAANVQAVGLPEAMPGGFWGVDVARWHTADKPDLTGMSYVWAVIPPVAAMAGIEFAAHFKMHKILRFGVLGFVALIAAVASYTHLVKVLVWQGQSMFVALTLPVAIDALMLLCTVSLLSGLGHKATPVPADVPPPAVPVFTVPFGTRPAPAMSWVPLGPDTPPVAVPPVPSSRRERPAPSVPTQSPVPAQRSRDGEKWDSAEAARLIMDGKGTAEICAVLWGDDWAEDKKAGETRRKRIIRLAKTIREQEEEMKAL